MLAVMVASLALLIGACTGSFAGEPKEHRVAIQVDQDDPAIMNLTLNNVSNIIEHYRAKGEPVEVDVIAFGPGLHMLRADTSPVKDRIKQITDAAFPSTIQYSACNNTKQGMERREGKSISLVPEATLVPSGAVHLIERQEQGWPYLRP
nr:hypothetical protein [Bradyrhizobium sp. Cp5.3]